MALPAALRGSLTWDQGVEMRDWKQVRMATDMAIFFCDPHAPWQRGTNENTNGLLRQYFRPKAPISRCTAQPTWTGSPPSSTTPPEND
jgi:IS30 family transposase